jgi:hypothetical protein
MPAEIMARLSCETIGSSDVLNEDEVTSLVAIAVGSKRSTVIQGSAPCGDSGGIRRLTVLTGSINVEVTEADALLVVQSTEESQVIFDHPLLQSIGRLRVRR